MSEHPTNINSSFLTSELLMIAPQEFDVNADTITTNSFQKIAISPSDLAFKACLEFEQYVEMLIKNNVRVHVFEGASDCYSPDRIYPNNWISFHQQCTILYPMQPMNRRSERCQPVFDCIPEKYRQRPIIDWTHYEREDKFLEGTGSLVLDRKNCIAFAALSPRTDETLVKKWCERMEYDSMVFTAYAPGTNAPVYHTNVVMSILENHLIIGWDCIGDEVVKLNFQTYAERCNKSIVVLSPEQISEFAANILEFKDVAGGSCIAISIRALRSLSPEQLRVLESAGNIIPVNLEYIERFGGGSARCMLTELF